ncbi:DUF7321 family protein [Halogeometricum borinquense]|nr:hypothetical protein [Halogeometricum borinquense]
MVSDAAIATGAALMVTVSFPFYIYGAWIMIDTETVTWDVLIYHLKFIVPGLILTTVPVVFWMAPRLLDQLGGFSALHAVLGLQAYALLAFALTGIIRIYQAKRNADLYHDPDQDIELDDLHENMGAWRGRLRIGVFGYVILWILAWFLGIYQYVSSYLL